MYTYILAYLNNYLYTPKSGINSESYLHNAIHTHMYIYFYILLRRYVHAWFFIWYLFLLHESVIRIISRLSLHRSRFLFQTKVSYENLISQLSTYNEKLPNIKSIGSYIYQMILRLTAQTGEKVRHKKAFQDVYLFYECKLCKWFT